MGELPADFAEMLARIVEPAHQADVAEIIDAAAQLDDEGLRKFLQKFADRVRSTAAPITREELRSFLREAKAGGPAGAP
jgi:hypothetical protein